MVAVKNCGWPVLWIPYLRIKDRVLLFCFAVEATPITIPLFCGNTNKGLFHFFFGRRTREEINIFAECKSR